MATIDAINVTFPDGVERELSAVMTDGADLPGGGGGGSSFSFNVYEKTYGEHDKSTNDRIFIELPDNKNVLISRLDEDDMPKNVTYLQIAFPFVIDTDNFIFKQFAYDYDLECFNPSIVDDSTIEIHFTDGTIGGDYDRSFIIVATEKECLIIYA